MTPKQQRFIAEYLVDLNGTQAAIRAGYSKRSAKFTAHELLASPEIEAAISKARERQLTRVESKADWVLEELQRIASADSNELIEHRRVACRYCWGVGHRYQRTPAERERDYAKWLKLAQMAMDKTERTAMRGDAVATAMLEFDEMGGVGYTKKRDPHPDCPECDGDGVEMPFVKDTRRLSPAARSLYAGVKITADGLQVQQHSKDKALELLGRHHGLWNEPAAAPPTGPGMVVQIIQGAQSDGSGRVVAYVPVCLPKPER